MRRRLSKQQKQQKGIRRRDQKTLQRGRGAAAAAFGAIDLYTLYIFIMAVEGYSDFVEVYM